MFLSSPIRTPRLTLRNLSEDDAGHVYLGWMQDPNILRHLEIRHSQPQTKASLTSFISTTNKSADTLLLGIFLRETGQHIGNIKLGPIDPYNRRADIGFLIGERSCWGKGYASEAIQATARHGIQSYKLHKVTAGCYASNIGSKGALTKAGFANEATLREHWFMGDHFDDHYYFTFIDPGSTP
ncbi:MAG: GNAT family N-acetyltransferase [Rhodospirillaceae bacterium]|nr:GNAT family N-acetyltransferase [Rhodospirillaceae bacterium]